MPKKVILDVDTGSDDAVAIMAAMLHPDIDLVAVCSVAGNSPIDHTTDNSLRVVDSLGGCVPVYRGCATSLAKHVAPWRGEFAFSHPNGVDEHGNLIKTHPDTLPFPDPTSREMGIPAPAFYVDYLKKATEPVTLVAVGPLTNLAAAHIMDPTVFDNVEEIIIMGGGWNLANQGVLAEFNIWFDPEAAQHVAHCGAKVTFVPLDATHASAFTMDDAATLRGYRRYACDKAADMIEQRIKAANAMMPNNPPGFTAVHDALALIAAVDYSVLTQVEHVHLDIGLSDYGEGATIINRSPRLFNKPGDFNAYFAYSSDLPRYRELLFDALRRSQPV